MRHIIKALVVSTVVVLVPMSAIAGEYYVSYMARDLMIAVDLENITWRGRVATVWVTAFSRDLPDSKGKKVAYMVTQDDYDCDAKRMRTSTMVIYDTENEHIDTMGPIPNWKALVPESRGSVTLKAICDAASRDPERIVDATRVELYERWRTLPAK